MSNPHRRIRVEIVVTRYARVLVSSVLAGFIARASSRSLLHAQDILPIQGDQGAAVALPDRAYVRSCCGRESFWHISASARWGASCPRQGIPTQSGSSKSIEPSSCLSFSGRQALREEGIMARSFTPEHTLERLKKEAKHWLKALRAGDEKARARLTSALPDAPDAPTLRDVQHAIASELEVPGWAALKEAFATALPAGSRASLVNRFLDNACPDHHVRGLQDHLRARHTAMRLLHRHPEVAHDSFHTAGVCGDLAAVRQSLSANPALATTKSPGLSPFRAMAGGSGDLFQDLGPKGWEPLLYLCFTRLPLATTNEHAVDIARLLLEHGANPNAYFMAGSADTRRWWAIGGAKDRPPIHDRTISRLSSMLGPSRTTKVIYNLGFSRLPLVPAADPRASIRLGRKADWEDQVDDVEHGPYGTARAGC
jgi:hypothetical protein